MKPLPESPMLQHNRLIEALCADWRESGIITLKSNLTPRANAVREVARQTRKERGK